MFCCVLMSSMEQLEYVPIGDGIWLKLKSVCPFPLQAFWPQNCDLRHRHATCEETCVEWLGHRVSSNKLLEIGRGHGGISMLLQHDFATKAFSRSLATCKQDYSLYLVVLSVQNPFRQHLFFGAKSQQVCHIGWTHNVGGLSLGGFIGEDTTRPAMITTTRASLQLPLPEASHSWCKSTSWHAHGKAGHSTRFQLNSCSGSPKKSFARMAQPSHDGTVANKLFARNTWQNLVPSSSKAVCIVCRQQFDVVQWQESSKQILDFMTV